MFCFLYFYCFSRESFLLEVHFFADGDESEEEMLHPVTLRRRAKKTRITGLRPGTRYLIRLIARSRHRDSKPQTVWVETHVPKPEKYEMCLCKLRIEAVDGK